MQFNEIDYYSELIVKSLANPESMTFGEHEDLNKWLEDPCHKALYDMYAQEQSFSEKSLSLRSWADSRNAYTKFSAHTKKLKTRKVVQNLVFMFVSAAAILLAVFLLFYEDKKESAKIVATEETQKVVAPIPAGEKKAFMALASGTNISIYDNGQNTIDSIGNIIAKSAVQKEARETMIFDTLIVPRGGEYSMVLADGTIVYLNSQSRLIIPRKFSSKERRVKAEGEIYFEVAKDAKRRFVVETCSGDIVALGTEFNVRSYGEQSAVATTLVEGKVEVCTASKKVMLHPGQQSIASTSSVDVREVNVDEFISWKKGYFLFSGTPLGSIAETVSRWYNVEFEFADTSIMNYSFSGMVKRYENLDIILNMLQIPGNIRFEYANGKVTAYKKN